MRGHLGSQIERKAETNLRLSKGSNGVVEMFGERCRNAFIPKGQGAFFQWSDDAMMHVSCEPPAGKAEVKAAAEIEARDAAFAGAVGAMDYAELRERIMKTMGIKNRASEGRIKQWLSGGLVAKDDAGRYRKAI